MKRHFTVVEYTVTDDTKLDESTLVNLVSSFFESLAPEQTDYITIVTNGITLPLRNKVCLQRHSVFNY